MTRIFTTLACTDALALLASYALGCWSRFFDGAGLSPGQAFMLHFMFGLFSSVGTLLVHCLIFTYFLGTGRWVKEVAMAYDLPDARFYKPTRELKRETFPIALAAMLITIAAASAGAGAQLQGWHWTIHFSLATIALAVNLWAFAREHRNVNRNAALLDSVLVEVDRIRAERGLPPNEVALMEDEGVQG